MQLRLIVVIDGVEHELMLDCQPSASVADVADALAANLASGKMSSSLHLRYQRSGERLSATTPIRESGLRHGDRIVVEATNPGGAADGVAWHGELLVVGGPEAGRRIPMVRDRVTVGRDPTQADVSIHDPSLSRVHLSVRASESGLSVTDLGSRNGTAVEGVGLAPHAERTLLAGEVVRIGRTLLSFDPVGLSARSVEPNEHGWVPFNRPPRLAGPPTEVVKQLSAPPEDPPRNRLPLAASLLPLIFALVMYFYSGAAGNEGLLLFALLTPVMAVGTFIEDRRGDRKEFGDRARKWRQDLRQAAAELVTARAQEVLERRSTAPDGSNLVARATLSADGLWERRPHDADFLSLRLGDVDQPSLLHMEVSGGGSDRLRAEADRLFAKSTNVPMVPLNADLKLVGSIGLTGDRGAIVASARFLVAQLAVLHSPRDVVIVAGVGEESSEEWGWLKWLPHCASEASPIPGSQLRTGHQATTLVTELAAMITARLDARKREFAISDGGSLPLPVVVAIIDQSIAVDRAAVDRILVLGPASGIFAIWLGGQIRELPGGCGSIAEMDPEVARLTWTDARNHGTPIPDVTRSELFTAVARQIALAMAPLRDVAADVSKALIPRRVSLLDILGMDGPDGSEWVVAQWATPRPDVSAPLGVSDGGMFTVDLSHDGPHGLIAGTTGAGKSELLQTLVASLCAKHPPSRLTFLLIDYKGGAAFKECTAFPHTVGFVTDLDAHLTRRALISLNAELRHREHVLANAGAKDLPSMLRSHPDEAPPRLVIVVDEFATLAKEVPDFVEGLVDVAQRGRSLGVHMLLATQRPAGVVTPSIRANTNLRISLRVADATESDDVIGTPFAAGIPREIPGRAYARTGQSELVEFQTAYVGGRIASAGSQAKVVIAEMGFDGSPIASSQVGPVLAHEAHTELQALVEASGGASLKLNLPAARQPWKPPLPALVSIADRMLADAELSATSAALGLVDEPANQSQRPFVFDLERDGSMLIFGSNGSGKTNLLRTLAAAQAQRIPPQELSIYGVDFGSRGLSPLEALPQCGSVLSGDDEERTLRLLSMVRKQIKLRKEVFAKHGVFGLAELARTVPEESPPRLLVLIDGYESFVATYERVDFGALLEELPRLISDGRSTGVHFAISAERRGSVSMPLLSAVPNRIVLRMADEDDYAAFGLPWRTLKDAKLPPGRGFVEDGLEMQVAVIGDAPAPAAQARAIAALGEELGVQWPDAHAEPIGILPTTVPAEGLPVAHGPGVAMLGLGDEDLAPVSIDLGQANFLVAGRRRTGRSTTLGTIARSLRVSSPDAQLHLLAPKRSPLTTLEIWDSVAQGVDECDARISELAAELGSVGAPLILVIDDAEELLETFSADDLDRLVAAEHDSRASVIVAIDTDSALRAYAGWLGRLRKDEQGMLLQPDNDTDGDLLGARLPRATGRRLPPGRGYLIVGGRVQLVQSAT